MLIRAELKTEAKQLLQNRWGISGLAFLLLAIVSLAVQAVPFIGPFLGIFVIGPVALGTAIYSIAISNNQNPGIDVAFKGFESFLKATGLYFWLLLWVFLWTLLLVIPGIIKAFSYSMAFYIMADNPEITVKEALNESKRMTNGHKMDLFILGLSFIGWSLLCILTLGIGYFWLISYTNVTFANAYKKLKVRAEIAAV